MAPSRDEGIERGSRQDRNRHSMTRLGLMVAVTSMVATMAPPALMVATFSSMALVAAMVITGFAVVFRERPTARHFTRWDEAMACWA